VIIAVVDTVNQRAGLERRHERYDTDERYAVRTTQTTGAAAVAAADGGDRDRRP